MRGSSGSINNEPELFCAHTIFKNVKYGINSMSTKAISVYIFLYIFVLCNNIRGEAPERRWSISAGAKTRRVEYSFDSRGLDNWQDYITPLQSRGSLNLCDGSERVEYENGYVGIRSSMPGIGHSGTTGNGLGEGDVGLLSFYSTHYGDANMSISANSSSIDETYAEPYIKAAYMLADKQKGQIKISLLGGAFHSSFNKSISINQSIIQNRTIYEFLYQAQTDSGGVAPGVIYNADDASEFTDEGVINKIDLDSSYPQRNITSQDTVVAGTLNGVMDAEVDIYWYELTLGLDWTQTLFNRLDLFALVGPTMHVLDWEMEHSTTWTVAGENSPATTTRASDDGTKTLVGGVAELGINLYLDSDRRYFIEASGEYLYLEDVTLNAGAASVNIDPESWGGKLGIGIRL